VDWEEFLQRRETYNPEESTPFAGADAPLTSDPGGEPEWPKSRLRETADAKQEPFERIRNFDEVALATPSNWPSKKRRGVFTARSRCASTAVRSPSTFRFIKEMVAGDFAAASGRSRNERAAGGVRPSLPAGRTVREDVRPRQEGQLVGIGRLERFLADWRPLAA